MSDDLYKQAAEIIKSIKYINLATVTSDSMPWNSPVYCAYDSDLNFYWLSWKENQHSINIHQNENVFATLYNSTVAEGTGFGVYFQGTARKIEEIPLLIKALKLCYSRKDKKARAVKLFLTSYPRRVYQFSPKKIWVNGDDLIRGNFIDVRHELDFKILKKELKNV